jgi:hypothetical protein
MWQWIWFFYLILGAHSACLHQGKWYQTPSSTHQWKKISIRPYSNNCVPTETISKGEHLYKAGFHSQCKTPIYGKPTTKPVTIPISLLDNMPKQKGVYQSFTRFSTDTICIHPLSVKVTQQRNPYSLDAVWRKKFHLDM